MASNLYKDNTFKSYETEKPSLITGQDTSMEEEKKHEQSTIIQRDGISNPLWSNDDKVMAIEETKSEIYNHDPKSATNCNYPDLMNGEGNYKPENEKPKLNGHIISNTEDVDEYKPGETNKREHLFSGDANFMKDASIPEPNKTENSGTSFVDKTINYFSSLKDKIMPKSTSTSVKHEKNSHNHHRKYYWLPTTDKKIWSIIQDKMKRIERERPPLNKTLEEIQQIKILLSDKNRRSPTEHNMVILQTFFENLNPEEQINYREQVLPFIANLVHQTPIIFPHWRLIPFLTKGIEEKFLLSRKQCACLLANMFMCTTLNHYNPDLPNRYNFSELYHDAPNFYGSIVKYQKIVSLMSYFCQIQKHLPDEFITFSRLQMNSYIHKGDDWDAWLNCYETLQPAQISLGSKIEDCENAIEIDFANKYLGGGVLGSGAVQEEILLITRPELIVALLFCEKMGEKEAILIQGARVFSGYTGYSDTFMSAERTLKDNGMREVVAIDAIDFSKMDYTEQFTNRNILRELNKAYLGFYGDTYNRMASDRVISTGSWGCGAFKGDFDLKLLLQYLAASRAGRKIVFHLRDSVKVQKLIKVLDAYQGRMVMEMVKDILDCSEHINRSRYGKIELIDSLEKYKIKKGFNKGVGNSLEKWQ